MRMVENIITSTPNSGVLGNSTSLIKDRFGRTFTYLRLALNEQCNLRCVYCMPEEGISFQRKKQLLTKDEIFRLLTIVTKLGVSKVRFTGGEPLLRKNISELISFAKNHAGIKSIHLTTNGLLLEDYLNELESAGLTGINISLDTLKADRFKKITRRKGFRQVLKGLELTLKSTIKLVKLNVVVMRGFNSDELLDFAKLTIDNNITVRFIELMPFDSRQIWKTGKFYRAKQIVEYLHSCTSLQPAEGTNTEHYSFKMEGARGKIAVIPAYSRNLCGACNRIRITADGKLLNCLFSQKEINLRDSMRLGVSDKKIKSIIQESFFKKHRDGWAAQQSIGTSRESMTQIGG